MPTIMSLLAIAAIIVIDRPVGLDRLFGLTRKD